ncbi:MAG: HAD family hydrolase, partial [Roseovarius sp.]
MSIMVGVGKGAQNGILIKNAESFERAEKVTHLITDKTGTLTEGKPSVVAVQAPEGIETDDLLRLAAAVESQSEHPLARAVVDKAKQEGFELPDITDFESTTGGGVKARVEGEIIRIGKRAFLEAANISIPDALKQEAERLQAEAKTVIWASRDDQLLGLIAIAD